MIKELITSEVMDVSPALAERWLKLNHEKQRKLSWARVESFVTDMSAGAWELTHQGICFGEDGELIDGQHRLHAIVRSGKTVRMLILTNQSGKFEAPIDRGRPRILSNICGVPHKRLAALNLLKQMESGYPTGIPFTLHDAGVYTEHHGESLERLDTIRNFRKLPAGAVAAAAWALPINETRVMEFITQVVTGEMLSKGQPALTFRRWTERIGAGKNGRINPWDMAMATCNCLRHVIVGGDYEKVYTGPIGYRALTTQRRKLRVPHTPSNDLVESKSINVEQSEAAE